VAPLAWFDLGIAIGVALGLAGLYGFSSWRSASKARKHRQRLENGNGRHER